MNFTLETLMGSVPGVVVMLIFIDYRVKRLEKDSEQDRRDMRETLDGFMKRFEQQTTLFFSHQMACVEKFLTKEDHQRQLDQVNQFVGVMDAKLTAAHERISAFVAGRKQPENRNE